MLVSVKRVIKSGFVNFWRNSFVSIASILVMVVALFVLASLILSNFLLKSELEGLQEKVDINVYFLTTAFEEDILDLKKRIEALPEVALVEYVSRDEALNRFKARHENDQLTLQALEELGENPLGASLNIRARETSQYAGVAKFLQSETALGSEQSIVDSVNYNQNKVAIDRLTTIIDQSEKTKQAQAIFLALVAVFVTFNTIQLVIYNSREEIGVMRLVGASNTYIRGPFVFEGMMYGVIAAIIVLLILYPITYWFGSYFSPFPPFSEDLSDVRVFSFYISNFLYIMAAVLGAGAVLGAISSYLAVRKYLKI